MKKIFLFVLCAPLLMASTCDNENDQIVCTTQFVYGLNVFVLDAESGQPLVEGVTVSAVDGNYQENLELIPGLEYSFVGAGERTGTYTVTVIKEGYQTFSSTPIVITSDVCHVIPQSLTVNIHSN